MPARRLDVSDGKKTCVKCGARKPLGEFYPRPAKAVGVSSACKPCESARTNRYNKRESAGHARRQREYRSRHPSRASASVQAWLARNPGAAARYSAERTAAELQRTPPWLTDFDRAQIAAMYAQAAEITRTTGVPHEVDHIFPLRGRTVHGLHVPANLRVVPRTENRRKGNACPAM